jgi:rhodanese-related sulfurtransferase
MVGTIRDVSVTNFAEEVESAPKDSFLVLDVREPRELDLARLRTIPHINVPMSKLGNAAAVLEPIDPSKAVYVIVSTSRYYHSIIAGFYVYSWVTCTNTAVSPRRAVSNGCGVSIQHRAL